MITVHGLLGRPTDALFEAAARADLVVGGARHLDALGVPPERRITLGALRPAVERISLMPPTKDVVVVASGDPLYFGVVRSLRSRGLRPAVVPAVSSIAAAFAAVGLPWDDAAVVSVHERPLQTALDVAQTAAKVAVFTSAEHGVRELADGLRDLPRWYVLAERLGDSDERVRVLNADEALLAEPLQPNVVLILDRPPEADDAPWSGAVAGPEPAGPEQTGPEAEHAAPAATPGSRPDATAAGTAPYVTSSADGGAASSEPVIGQVTSGAASEQRADAIDRALGVTTRRYTDGAKAGLPQAWRECDLIVSHLALGATTRIIAPLLADKRTDPGVVVIDEAGRFAVPLVGGHAGGANALAARLADALGATAVLTTATDAVGLPALDTIGWPYAGAVAEVTRALLDGRPVQLVRTQPLPPLPPLPANLAVDAEDPVAAVVVSDQLHPLADSDETLPTVTLRPPSLIAGMGCNRGTSAESLRTLLTRTLQQAGLAAESLRAITSVDAKADEQGLIELAAELGIEFRTHPAAALATHEVPNPSAHAQAAVGTPSVAEASVLAEGAELIVPKQRTPEATCAIGRLPARGHLAVVGLGPGSRDLTTPRAQQAIRSASVIVGYQPYVDQVTDLIAPAAEVHASGMGTEAARTALAIAKAREGRSVALVCSGDPAIYAMASPTLEQGTEGIDVEIVPGVTASLAASAILGAPLGHDHATISLSDLHTDWPTIERRLQAAAEADLVTVLYNPRSRTRLMHLPRALQIFAAHRPATTPVAVVEEACRPDQKVTTATLADFDADWVNMNSLVVIGSSTTTYLPAPAGATYMVTPRDYHWMKR